MTENRPRAPHLPLAHYARRKRMAYKILNRLERMIFARRHRLWASDPRIRRIRGRLRLVEVDKVAHPRDVADRNLELAVTACTRLGIPFFSIPGNWERHRLGIPEEHWVPLLREIAAGAPASQFITYVGTDWRRRRTDIATSADQDLNTALRQSVVGVGTWFADPRSAEVFGPAFACELQRWAAQPDGTYAAPLPNPITTQLSLDLLERREHVAVPLHLPGASEPGVFDVTFDIDLVVLWVDGSDPEWQRRRDASLAQELGLDHVISNSESRYRDNGELRYMLRSAYRYAPWFRRVYLVTDRQRPSWLANEHPGLVLVSHEELFQGTGIPSSFNSHAIAARLHHIPGLSEHFVVTNDDIFFGNPIRPDAFFLSSGLARFHLSRSTLAVRDRRLELPHEAARHNAARLVHSSLGRTPRQNFKHIPLAMKRSILDELEERFTKELHATWRSRFRSGEDVEIGWLHHYTAYLTGRAIPGSMRYDYFQASSQDAWSRLSTLQKRRHLQVFCINDDDLTSSSQVSRIREWLEDYFPEPSPWERVD